MDVNFTAAQAYKCKVAVFVTIFYTDHMKT